MKWFLALGAAFLGACGAQPAGAEDLAELRQKMVQSQIAARDITNARVIEAMRKVPRHEFVPEKVRHLAYRDSPLSIGHEQTISQPYIVAFMTQAIDPQRGERILEIGTGSGYQAAVLAEMGATVYSIEIVEPLAKSAEQTLQPLGYKDVHTKAGDGYQGWSAHAPFDAIIVTAAPDHVPQPLIDQLKEGGRLIVPVGKQTGSQELYLLEKRSGKIQRRAILPVRFVPMTGKAQE